MEWVDAAALALAVLLDRLLGEPRRWHPLIGLGYVIKAVEQRLNRDCFSFRRRRLLGLIALLLILACVFCLVVPLFRFIGASTVAYLWFCALSLYLVIGARSLEEHALAVKDALAINDLVLARVRVSYIVSRETGELDAIGVTRATLESVLENGSDALLAPLFWFVVAGPVGAVGYRVINTLDAMWGYRNARFQAFGWAAARLDDWVNWIPARLCALTYAAVASKGRGFGRQGLDCWRKQAGECESPNAGPVMACGAGALNVELGGAAIYHGQLLARPILGKGASPQPVDIDRALALLKRSMVLWVSLYLLLAVCKQVLL